METELHDLRQEVGDLKTHIRNLYVSTGNCQISLSNLLVNQYYSFDVFIALRYFFEYSLMHYVDTAIPRFIDSERLVDSEIKLRSKWVHYNKYDFEAKYPVQELRTTKSYAAIDIDRNQAQDLRKTESLDYKKTKIDNDDIAPLIPATAGNQGSEIGLLIFEKLKVANTSFIPIR